MFPPRWPGWASLPTRCSCTLTLPVQRDEQRPAALMGFDCAANFDLPYISASITEFWRRWHIPCPAGSGLSSIPLGGNRRGAARQMLNMFLVWAATGIWHGANWNFIVWGLYYFVLLVIEKRISC